MRCQFGVGDALTIDEVKVTWPSGAVTVKTNVAVDGQIMTFSLSEVGMDAELEFEGDEFSGFLAGGMGDADIYGVKRSGG